jgi:hypothetical protein
MKNELILIKKNVNNIIKLEKIIMKILKQLQNNMHDNYLEELI